MCPRGCPEDQLREPLPRVPLPDAALASARPRRSPSPTCGKLVLCHPFFACGASSHVLLGSCFVSHGRGALTSVQGHPLLEDKQHLFCLTSA